MVSLGAVESQVEEIFKDEIESIAVNLPDEKKGEHIVLLYRGDLSEKEVSERIKNSQMAPMMQPSHTMKVDELPKLASGKADFKGAKSLALEVVESETAGI